MSKIIVNGREREIDLDELSYQQIVNLVFGGLMTKTVYTVTYSRGRYSNHGSIINGDTIKVTDGMVINVGLTNNA